MEIQNTSHHIKQMESAETNKSSTADEFLWSIDDDTLFYPLGLINHDPGGGRFVFLTWSDHYLLNFIFKATDKTKRTTLSKVVRISMPISTVDQQAEEIVYIQLLALNTLLLMRSGRVYYFSSMKAIKIIEWLDGVRCLCTANEGFSLIRTMPDKTLQLQVYRDVMNSGKQTVLEPILLQSYDISFDEQNLFNCNWQDECFSMNSQVVLPEQKYFLQMIIRESCELELMQQLHFFSICNNLFVLIAAAQTTEAEAAACTDYNIQLLCTYADNVQCMHILYSQQLCLIFLQNGSVDIWYRSEISKMLSRSNYEMGSTFLHYDFCAKTSTFYFTDGEQVAQLQFKYEATKDTCIVLNSHKAIPDMLACTWVESIQQLICLSANNIFYHLTFEQPTEQSVLLLEDFEKLPKLYELTSSKVTHLLQQAVTVKELNELPNKLKIEMEKVYMQKQLLAVAEKSSLYSKLLQAQLEFCLKAPAPANEENTVLLYTKSQCICNAGSYFALIHLQLKKHIIFESADWSLCINYDCYSQLLHLQQPLLFRKLCIVIPLQRYMDEADAVLPAFQLKLLTFVQSHEQSDVLIISLPIELKTSTATYKGLFHLNSYGLTLNEYSLEHLFSHAKDTAGAKHLKFTYTVALPSECTFQHILQLFDAANEYILDVKQDKLELYFMSKQLTLQYVEEEQQHCLQMHSTSAIVLFYVRKMLFLFFQQKQWQRIQNNECNSQLRQLLQCQCEMERQVDRPSNETENALHLEKLQRIYVKLRTQLCSALR